MQAITSLPDICEVYQFAGPRAGEQPTVFIELPHGATTLAHLDRAKARTRIYDPRYDSFFLANTDQGSPEYAHRLARWMTDPEAAATLAGADDQLAQAYRRLAEHTRVLVVRALLPRTIVDVNRVWEMNEEQRKQARLTGVHAPFIPEEDLPGIRQAHRHYNLTAARAYDLVCGSGGHAFNLHTYAPISVNIVEGEHIVDTLQRAYLPENVGSFPRRPAVELITAPPEAPSLAPAELVTLLKRSYAEIGIEAVENDPFPLHPLTSCHDHAQRHPGKILIMEISRDLLAEPFDPFIEMFIDPARVERMTRPIAAAWYRFRATP